MTTEQSRADEQEILRLVAEWRHAIEARDPARIVAAYTPETVLFDAIPPAKTVGAEAIKVLWENCLPYFPARFRAEHDQIDVQLSGDLAHVHGFFRFVPEDPSHPAGTTTMRMSVVFRRIDGRWRVTHEHVSVPFDPMSGKAVYLDSAGAAITTEGGANASPARLQTYLFFRGRCEEAIEFYRRVLGAEVGMIMRFRDNPDRPGPGEVPAGFDERIMHASLQIAGTTLMMSDGMQSGPLDLECMSLSLSVAEEAEVDRLFAALAVEGAVQMPLGPTFFAKRFGAVKDKFGVSWMIIAEN
jgi:PhnB protein